MLEREIATLDVPYGETFCVQEREATTVDDGSRGAASTAPRAAAASPTMRCSTSTSTTAGHGWCGCSCARTSISARSSG